MNYQYKEDALYILKEDESFLVHVTFPKVEEGTVNINHTYVDVSLRGQGVASDMMHAAMAYIISKGLKVVATCPYAVTWLKRHKAYDMHVNHALMEHMGEACII
jgi:predicted GNAT family acetyltransferase